MCLAAIAVDAHPGFALVIAANRDEFHAREAAAAAWWEEGVLGGRDLRAGGTWLCVDRRGRFAFVTNVREPGRHDPRLRSRGELPLAVVTSALPVDAAVEALMREAATWNGFNLVAGDASQVVYASNRPEGNDREGNRHGRADAGIVALAAGVHAVSNAALDVPWPKVVATREAMRRWCAEGREDPAPLWRALADRDVAVDDALPSTGLARERERLLSAAFIVDPAYGTRASTIFTVSRDGRARFVERSFDATARETGRVDERFDVAAAGPPARGLAPAHVG